MKGTKNLLFFVGLVVITTKAASLAWLGYSHESWLLGLSAIPFWIVMNLSIGMLLDFLFGGIDSWGLFFFNIIILIPLLTFAHVKMSDNVSLAVATSKNLWVSSLPSSLTTETRKQKSTVVQSSSLRYDGIYKCEQNGYCSYLRFYPNGDVITTSTSGKPENIRKWFTIEKRDNPGISFGKVTTKNNQLTFSVASSQGSVDFAGEINGDTLRLDIYSRINGNKSNWEYVFLNIPL